MKYLVTGGAGYIGSFMVKSLLERGEEVVVLDNLERGHDWAVSKGAILVTGDIRDKSILHKIFEENKIEAIFHFAGLISVEESTKNPNMYFENNVLGSKILFETAVEKGIKKFIFSSTAAVYGNPEIIPIPEDHPKAPTSPYGESKLETEQNLSGLREDNPDVSFVCLRYFNACGAALDGSLGEDHKPETHIIPLAIKAARSGQEFKIFGTDYDTPDGSCLRDYIHVLDLIDAHFLALGHISTNPGGYFFNVGTGKGISNREIIEEVKRISGKDFPVVEFERRAGDADRLIADPTKINSLGFSPKYSDIKTIIESAWNWHNSR